MERSIGVMSCVDAEAYGMSKLVATVADSKDTEIAKYNYFMLIGFESDSTADCSIVGAVSPHQTFFATRALLKSFMTTLEQLPIKEQLMLTMLMRHDIEKILEEALK